MPAPMRLPIKPPSAAPARPAAMRSPVPPPNCDPIRPPATAPTSVPVFSFGPWPVSGVPLQAAIGSATRAAAAGHLLALLRRKPRPVVVDHDAHDPTIISGIRLFRERLDRHPRLCPLAGIVDKVADHFLEVLLLATEAGALGRVDVDGDTAMVVNLFHRACERRYHRTHIGDGTDRGDARG